MALSHFKHYTLRALFPLFMFSGLIDAQTTAATQPESGGDWVRIQTANNELSVAVPKEFSFFRSKEGASDPQVGGGLYWREMRLISSYVDGTLISLETYEESKEALDRVFRDDSIQLSIDSVAVTRKAESFNRDGISVRQVTQTSADSYMVRRYLSSKKHIYILTAATRGGESAAMKRFLDSLIFNPKVTNVSPSNAINIDGLDVSALNIVTKNVAGASDSEEVKLLAKQRNSQFILLLKPRPTYTDGARQNNVQGVVRLRPAFGPMGNISKLEIITSLPNGLVRQAIFAALRMKFMPDEEGGRGRPFEGVVEYRFTIY